MRVMTPGEGLVECCDGLLDHVLDCEHYVGVDVNAHNASLMVNEPVRADLRVMVTSENLRKQALAKQNGHGSHGTITRRLP